MYLWVKVACLLFNAFWTYKNIWMKVACLHFGRFFMYVKSFCKKRPEIIPNDLIYITTSGTQTWYLNGPMDLKDLTFFENVVRFIEFWATAYANNHFNASNFDDFLSSQHFSDISTLNILNYSVETHIITFSEIA